MSDCKAKMHQNPISAGASPWTPLEAYVRSPDPQVRKPTSKSGGDGSRKGRNSRKGREG